MTGFIFASTVVLFAVGGMCLPIDVPFTDFILPKMLKEPATDLLLPKNESGLVAEWTSTDGPTPANDIIPSSLSGETNERKLPVILYVINVLAVKNSSAEDSNDVLHSDVIGEVPSGVAVPLALFLLVIEDEDENHPVSLDDVGRDLEKEGFTVEKIIKDGETRLIKVDLDTVESTLRIPKGSNDFNNLIEHETEIQESGKLISVRRKRHICLECKLEKLKQKMYSKYGGCNTCGGGQPTYYVQPVQIQPIYQPVQVQPVYQPVVYEPVYQYPAHHVSYPQHEGCNVCGGHGGEGGGGGYTYSQATASASSVSYGYGR